jgi:hypothetical protein
MIMEGNDDVRLRDGIAIAQVYPGEYPESGF